MATGLGLGKIEGDRGQWLRTGDNGRVDHESPPEPFPRVCGGRRPGTEGSAPAVSNRPATEASRGWTEGGSGFASGGVQLEAPVIQAFLTVCEERLRGLVGIENGPTVNIEGCHMSTGWLAASACARPSEMAAGHSLLGMFRSPRKSKLSLDKHSCTWPILPPLVGFLTGCRTCRTG